MSHPLTLALHHLSRVRCRTLDQLMYGENKITVKQYICQPEAESAATYRYMLYSPVEGRTRVGGAGTSACSS